MTKEKFRKAYALATTAIRTKLVGRVNGKWYRMSEAVERVQQLDELMKPMLEEQNTLVNLSFRFL